MLNVRIARMNDIERISFVLASSWKTAYRGMIGDEYLDSLQDDHWVNFLSSGLEGNYLVSMVLEDNGLVVGAAIAGETKTDGEIHLLSFYLLPEKTGQGFGGLFYRGVEAEMMKRGYDKCILDVLEENAKAIRFYEAQGFKDTGASTPATLGGVDYMCKVMEKAI